MLEFRESSQGELFRVFLADSTLTRVIKVVEVIPTPRWNDYAMHFERPAVDSLIVVGDAISGNAGVTRLSYDWLDWPRCRPT